MNRPVHLSAARGHVIRVALLVVSIGLAVAAYLVYRGPGWPLGTQGIEGLVAILVLVLTLVFGLWYGHRSHYRADGSLLVGLVVGMLWAVEITINNVLTPGLPLRSIVDNSVWAAVALAILVYSFIRARRSGSVLAGIGAGLWSGFATGLVACVVGLLFVVFGIHLIVADPLTVAEWSAQGPESGLTDPVVFSAYETLFGALAHLHLLGTVMGTLLGLVGGVAGGIRPQRSGGARGTSG